MSRNLMKLCCKVLAGLVKRIAKDAQAASIAAPADIDASGLFSA